MPFFAGITESFLRQTARLGIVPTAMAVELFRIDNEHFPKHLDELVPTYLPTLLEDPYDGEPLRYIPSEQGYKIYTIYSDQVDDEGKDAVRGEKGMVGDWALTVDRSVPFVPASVRAEEEEMR